MAANLGTLTLDLVAKTSNFVQGLNKAEREAKNFAGKTRKNLLSLSATFTALGTAAYGAALLMVKTYSKVIDENAKAAKQVESSYAGFVTLGKAAEDAGVSMSTLMSASRTLNREIGGAVAGNEKAIAAFKRIGLSAKELAEIPLDKRIGIINDALDKNVHASQRAAAAAEIFGSKNGQAMAYMDSKTINESAHALDVFGIRLSDIDAAKVEQANDAMATFGLVAKGVGSQLTVELAPVLKAVGDLFFETAEEAGGLGNMVKDSVGKAVAALAVLIDGADLVYRGFTVATGGTAIGLALVVKGIASIDKAILNLVDRIPGLQNIVKVPKAAVNEIYDAAERVISYNTERIKNSFSDPLKGGVFLDFYNKAQAEGEKAAAAAVKDIAARRAQGEVYENAAGKVDKLTKAQKEQRDVNQELIDRLQLEAATLGMSKKERELYTAALSKATTSQLDQIAALYDTIDAYEQNEKAADKYKSLVSSLRTEEERRTDTLREQIEIIKASGAASAEQAEMAARAAMQAAETSAPEFSGGDSILGEFYRYSQQEKELQEWYDKQLEMLNNYRQEFAEQSEVWDQKELEAKQRFNDQMAAIDAARSDMMLSTAETMFGSAAGIAKQFAGEHSKIYKALFAVEKAAAIARSIVAIQEGIALAAANPWPLNLGAMASVAAATAGIVSNIMAVGMAHDGMDEIPQTGSWILQKGERVMTEKTSAKLDKTLDDVKKTGTRKGGVVVNLHEDASKAGKSESKDRDDNSIIDIWVSNILQDGRAASALQNKYGLATVGR